MIQEVIDTKTGMEFHIISVASRLFKTFGINGLTMDDLANEMNISKKAILQYFRGRTELIDGVVSEQLRKDRIALQEARLFSSNAIEQVFLGWHVIHDFLYILNKETSDQLMRYYPQAFDVVSEFRNVFLYNHIKLNMDTGITQELYRNNIKTELITRYLIQMILSSEIIGPFTYGRVGYTETEDQILGYHLYAISTKKGAKLIQKYKNQLLAHTAYLK